MEMIAEAFRNGGIWMYLILMACIVGWPLAVLGVLTLLAKKPRLTMAAGALVVVVGLVTASLGVVGHTVAMMQVEDALVYATPENRERLRKKGEQLASHPLHFGLGGSSVPVVLGLLTFVGGAVRRSDSPP